MANIYSFSKIILLFKKLRTSDYLLVLIFITLPLKNIFISIATILFVFWSFFLIKKEVNFQKFFYFPIAFFILMISSLLWSYNFKNTFFGIQKQLPFLFVPFAFILLGKITKEWLLRIFRIYSFGMVFFGVLLLINTFVRYIDSKDTGVFFHNKLVPNDPGAIYLSVFASFAIFYFIQIQIKNNYEKASVFILALLIFLLSSKSIITIDFIIIICYYTFFVSISSGTKAITILSVSAFLFFSVLYVKEVRARFLIEYQTAFIDNTLNYDLTKEKNIYNVSINEAWNKRDFHQNSFFPGTALRVYQFRVFTEMLNEMPIFLKGCGLEASQHYIKNKAKQHNLNPIYGDYNFHNQYIQTFAELGIIGFFILVSMLFINLKNAFKYKDFLHITFAITMIMLFLSESFFCRQRGIIFFIVLYCLFNAASTQEK